MLYSFAGDTVAGSCKRKQQIFYLSSGHLICTVQRLCKEMCGMTPIKLLVWKINTREIVTTTKHTFSLWKFMLGWWICTHFWHGCVRWYCIYMTPMWNHRVFICIKYAISHFTRPLVLFILTLVVKASSNNDHSMLVNMNKYFWHIWITHNLARPCTKQISPWVGVAELIVV